MKWRTKRNLEWPTCDPYLSWAESTRWRGFRRLVGQRLGTGDSSIPTLRVLVQAKDSGTAKAAMAWPEWRVAEIYKTQSLKLRHFVAELDVQKLPWLRGLTCADLKWELALPFRDAETAARAQTIGAYGETRAAQDFRPLTSFNTEAPEQPDPLLQGPVMAVIDFGCPFMHAGLLRTSEGGEVRTRVRALWDQGAMRTPPPPRPGQLTEPAWPWWDMSPRMGYGRALCGSAMDAILKECRELGSDGHALDESEAYRRLDYLINYDDARRRIWSATHGSHVLDVAAGCPDPLLGERDPPDQASQADLVFVQLPSLTGADSGGGSLSAQVLDAVHYILDVCEDEARIVINLSYGSFAGPHDGSSLIEQALDEIVEKRKKNLAIVLGAGNGHQAACHVSRQVQPNRSALLRLRLEPGDYTDTYVETWFKPGEPLLRYVQARSRSADGDWSEWVGLGEQVLLHEPNDARPVACLSFQEKVPNGEGPLLLLAAAPTARPADDDGPMAPTGSWQIEIQLNAAAETLAAASSVELQSWIERDDPGWLGHGVQPRFEEQRLGDNEQTLSSLATGQYTIAAGGFRLSDGAPAPYSSEGPRKAQGLMVYGACEDSANQPHIRAAAIRSGDSLRMSGTSVAAPVLARRIFNHMAKPRGGSVNSTQWAVALDRIVEAEWEAARAEGRPSLLRKPLT